VVAGGHISDSDAKALLASVNYDADVTWNENTFFNKRNNVGSLLVGVILLAAILMGAALILGVFFGGFRILMKRLFPDRVFDRSKDVEIISLKLGE
jgi:predicted small integral membrane protein